MFILLKTKVVKVIEEDISRKASSQFNDISNCIEFIKKHQDTSDEKMISNINNQSNEVKTTNNEFTIVLITAEGKNKIQQFCEMTNAPKNIALSLLKEFQWNVVIAVNNYYTIKEAQSDEKKNNKMLSQHQKHSTSVKNEENKQANVTEWFQPESLIISTDRPRNEASCEISNCEWQYHENLPATEFNPYAFQVTDSDRLHIKKCHHDLYIRIQIHEEEKLRMNKCVGNVRNCVYLDHLVQMMRRYKDDTNSIDSVDVTLCLNGFVHLNSTHQTDQDFEYIFNALGGQCNLQKCEKFKRNHRNRFVEKKANDKNTENDPETDRYEAAKTQIMDKIHCVYSHCFDIGNRLTIKEQKSLDQTNEERKYDGKHGLVSNRVLKIHKILSNKNTSYQDSREITTSKNKFLSTFDNNQQNAMGKNKTYGYGFEFVYQNRYDYNGLIVCKKYKTMKEELTQNQICKIAMHEFRSEIEKAIIHYNCDYRRYKIRMKYMLLHHMLAVMIYCNYDELQSKFSVTYRKTSPTETDESVLQRHSNFYWLGMYLRETCLQCGITIADGHTKKFYHGINEEMVFPEILTANGVNIFCPLSTSSSYATAAQFAKNKGLIIEFADGNSMSKEYSAKYFDCAFISDFPNERECLFIQLKYGGLRFNNITHALHGYQFDIIFDALNIIDYILINHIKTVDTFARLPLAIKLIENKLFPKKIDEKFKLHDYAKNLVDIYFNNIKTKTEISMDLMYCQNECFRDECLKKLMPQLKIVNIYVLGTSITTEFPFTTYETNSSLLQHALQTKESNINVMRALREMSRSQIFEVLGAIDSATSGNKIKKQQKIQLAINFMEQKLSTDYPEFNEYKHAETFPERSQKLIDFYCSEKNNITIDLNVYSQIKCFHIKYLLILFPNVKSIIIKQGSKQVYNQNITYKDIVFDWQFYTEYKSTFSELNTLMETFKHIKIMHQDKCVCDYGNDCVKFDWDFYLQNLINIINHSTINRVEIKQLDKNKKYNIMYIQDDFNLRFDLGFYKMNVKPLKLHRFEEEKIDHLNYDVLMNKFKTTVNVTKNGQLIFSKTPLSTFTQIKFDWEYYLQNKWLQIANVATMFSGKNDVTLFSNGVKLCQYASTQKMLIVSWAKYKRFQNVIDDTILKNAFIIVDKVNIHDKIGCGDWKGIVYFRDCSVKCIIINTRGSDILIRNMVNILKVNQLKFRIEFDFEDTYQFNADNVEQFEEQFGAIGYIMQHKVERLYPIKWNRNVWTDVVRTISLCLNLR